MQPSHASSIKVFLTIEHIDKKTIKEKHEIATKLHNQFGHPADSIKLKQPLKDANITDITVVTPVIVIERYAIDQFSSLPLAKDFNDCLALDLQFLNIRNRQYTVLHMIDVFSCFSQATLIPSQHKDIIVQAIFKNWVSISGVPQSIFSDSGGEFDNHPLRNVAELLATQVTTIGSLFPMVQWHH